MQQVPTLNCPLLSSAIYRVCPQHELLRNFKFYVRMVTVALITTYSSNVAVVGLICCDANTSECGDSKLLFTIMAGLHCCTCTHPHFLWSFLYLPAPGHAAIFMELCMFDFSFWI